VDPLKPPVDPVKPVTPTSDLTLKISENEESLTKKVNDLTISLIVVLGLLFIITVWILVIKKICSESKFEGDDIEVTNEKTPGQIPNSRGKESFVELI